MQYYSWMVTTKDPSFIGQTSLNAAKVEATTRTINIANEMIRSQQALSITMRMLRDSYTAFPLHI